MSLLLHLFFSFFYSHLTILSLTLKLPSEKFLLSSHPFETPKLTLTISPSLKLTDAVPTEA